MTIGMLGAVAALGLWGVVLGLGFAETSVAEKSNTELAAVAASGGVPEAVAAATGAGTTKNAACGFLWRVPGRRVCRVHFTDTNRRRDHDWRNRPKGIRLLIIAIGVVSLVLTLVMPIKTEEGIVAFGIAAAVWGLTFLIMGLQIMRQDMNESSSSTASVESSE